MHDSRILPGSRRACAPTRLRVCWRRAICAMPPSRDWITRPRFWAPSNWTMSCRCVQPVWRPLLNGLMGKVQLAWPNPGAAGGAWFAGAIEFDRRPTPAAPQAVSCATPRAEVVEALRWTRELIALGRARPEEIAICATATQDWDDHILVLASDAG